MLYEVITLTELVRGQVPKVKVSYIPKLCHHCDEAPCMASCKVEAIYKREIAFVFVRYLLDNTVKGEEDIKEKFDIPVLGEIPDFACFKEKK